MKKSIQLGITLLVFWLGPGEPAMAQLTTGRYQITSGQYAEIGGLMGTWTQQIPNLQQSYVDLTIDAAGSNSSMVILGEDQQTRFACFTNGAIQGNAIAFQHPIENFYLVGSAYLGTARYVVTASASGLRFYGERRFPPMCCDIPNRFEHRDVQMQLISPTCSWRPEDTRPPVFALTPAAPGTNDLIRFFTPTDGFTYGNDCEASSGHGGYPYVSVDLASQTIWISFVGPAPFACPAVYMPVNGLEGTFGPLPAGNWTLMIGSNRVYRTVSFQVSGAGQADNPLDTWRVRHTAGAEMTGVAWGNGIFVATSCTGVLLTSADGMNWTRHGGDLMPLRSVAYGNGKFVAVGALTNTTASGQGVVVTSTNGIHWVTQLPTGLPGLTGVCFGDGMFLACSEEGALCKSADGVNWSASAGTNVRLESIVYGGGTCVAVGTNGTIMLAVSPYDGWADSQFTQPPRVLRGGAWNGRLFAAVGDDGLAAVSPEWPNVRQPWTTRTVTGGWQFKGIAGVAGIFAAVGVNNDGVGAILTSSNGLDWTVRNTRPATCLAAVAVGHCGVVAVDAGGKILQSDPLLKLVARSSRAEMEITGLPGLRCQVEACQELQGGLGWQPVSTFTITNGAFRWRDDTATNTPARFYRATLLP